MRKHKSDRLIAVLTFALMGLGLIVIYAIGPMRANFMNSVYDVDYDTNYFFMHQLISVILAAVAFVVAFKLPYTVTRRFAKIVMVAGLAACALLWMLSVMHSSLAKCELGACRWYNLGGLGSFQPVELLKLGLVLYLSGLTAERAREGKLDSWEDFWMPFGVVSVLSLFFVVVVQKDFGSAVPLVAIILVILWMSGVSQKRFWMVVVGLGAAAALSIVISPHRLERLQTYSGGEGADSYHIDNAMIAIGTGGFGGVGVGNSVQATGYLPESINDSVFAVMGETFGFVGLMVVMICFITLLYRLIRTAELAVDLEQSLVVVGVFGWIITHVVVNIAAMTGMIPLTGITLPLLSYGGTSMIFVAFALGLALQLSCYTGREVRKNESTSSRRGLRGSYHASRRSGA